MTDQVDKWAKLFDEIKRAEALEPDSWGEINGYGLVQALAALRLIQPYNWRTWIGEQGGLVARENVHLISLEDCVRYITGVVRADRFSSGTLAGALKSGWFRAICVHARDLAHGGQAPELPKEDL